MKNRPGMVAQPVCARITARRPARPRLLLAGLLSLPFAPQLGAQEVECGDGACSGLDAAAAYTADFRRNTRGGLARGSAVSGLFEAGLAWRSASLLPSAMVTTSASLIHVGGDGISGELVGDLQGLNNIEADAGWYLYDLWTEVSFGARQPASVRAGFLDLNAEFDTSDTAGFFIGPPFGIGTDLAQTGENGPGIYPVTALGLRIGGTLGEGALLIGEVDLTPHRLHKLAIGAWTYTASLEPIDAAATGDARRRRGDQSSQLSP